MVVPNPRCEMVDENPGQCGDPAVSPNGYQCFKSINDVPDEVMNAGLKTCGAWNPNAEC